MICISARRASALQANVRNYFMQFEEAQTQSLIDSKIMEFEMKSRQGLQVDSDYMLHLNVHTTSNTMPAHSDTASHCCPQVQLESNASLSNAAMMLLVRPDQSCVSSAGTASNNTSQCHVV